MVHYRTAGVQDHKVFYREAGNRKNPTLLLLHGFPTSSHMFRHLIALLSDRFHIVAPDRTEFKYTFDNLAKVVEAFTDAIGRKRYAIYVFDYGAPTGFRLANGGRRGSPRSSRKMATPMKKVSATDGLRFKILVRTDRRPS
jgi:pimeloyl-ACP methyl ester carboxylesterase